MRSSQMDKINQKLKTMDYTNEIEMFDTNMDGLVLLPDNEKNTKC